jgi:hypothetical protein
MAQGSSRQAYRQKDRRIRGSEGRRIVDEMRPVHGTV